MTAALRQPHLRVAVPASRHLLSHHLSGLPAWPQAVASNTLVDSTTGNTFTLSGQPSGHTASVMLPEPGGVQPAPTGAGQVQTYTDAAAAARWSNPPAAATADMGNQVDPPMPMTILAILDLFQDVLNPGTELLPQVSCNMAHFLSTKGPPVTSKLRRLDPEKLVAAQKEFAAMEAAGIARHSMSPWASLVHLVCKADGSWWPCGDYRRLNTVRNQTPTCCPMDFIAKAEGWVIFSKIDLKKGYNQVPMNPEDIPKTAIITPFGLFEFTCMTFGMRNASNTFQQLMDHVLAGLAFAFPYL